MGLKWTIWFTTKWISVRTLVSGIFSCLWLPLRAGSSCIATCNYAEESCIGRKKSENCVRSSL